MSQCRQVGAPAPTNSRCSRKRRQQTRLQRALERARYRALLLDVPEVSVCPACLASMALPVISAVSAGGVTAVAAKLIRKKDLQAKKSVSHNTKEKEK